MIVSLDHIAIAVADLEEAIRRYAEDLGLPLDGTEDVEAAKTKTAFLSIPGTHIELVHPLRGEGPIADSLTKRGPGLHHLCFRTDDLEADVARLKAKGWRFTTEGPTPGAHGTKVIFAHPRSTGGVLIELVEHPKAGGTPAATGGA